MKRSFPNIKFCLLVGIGGGVPSDANDIRLGDVVVSLPKGDLPGVIQYDRGKENGDVMFERTGALQGPPRALRALTNYLKSTPGGSSDMLLTYVEKIVESESVGGKERFNHPGEELDILFENCCPEGDTNPPRPPQIKHREPRPTNSPVVHYGIIASGNKVIKNAKFRNEWGQKYGVLCFEMEAAGVMNILPTLVIRGICDYCDAQKNKVWQEYAAATAAAYTRHLLIHLPCHEPDNRILWKRMNSDLSDAQTEGRPKKSIKIA
jgi:nucleoside phosphorylase